MEPFSFGLLICGVTVAMYQMPGTPFLLNIVIFCLVLLICLYAVYASGYHIPTDALYYWIYPSSKKTSSQDKRDDSTSEDYDDQITKKLRELTGHIVRDFILSWYNAVTDDVTFVQEAFELFEHILSGARTRAAEINKDTLLAGILNELLEHVLAFKQALAEVDSKGYNSSNMDDIQRRQQLIVIAYCARSAHPAAKSLPDSEMEYLRGIVIIILKGLLPEDYKITQSPLYLVRELIAQNVLNSLVNLMSDPLWIYNTLERVLSESSEDEITTTNLSVSEEIVNYDEQLCHPQTNDIVLPDQGDPVSTVNLTTEQADLPRTEINSGCAAENALSVSHSSSVVSQLSDESLDEMSNTRLEDIPLPLTSSEMHFAPEWDDVDCDTTAVKRHFLSVAVERAPQDKLFHRVRIVDSTIMKENYDGSKKYALYKITYRTKEKVPQSSGPVNIPGGEETSTHEESSQQELYITKRHQVQRRFREFLVLQERLSQNMVAKNLIADVKGPSRMFPVPFGNMEKEYIEQRRKFLQAYLREICSIPFVSHTKELREFLAFEMDPRIAYVKKPDPIPRFDKLFKSAIQDLLGSTTMKISSSLPNDAVSAYKNKPNDSHRRQSSEGANFVSNEVNNMGAVAKLKNKVFGVSKHHIHDKPAITRTSRQFAGFMGQRSEILPRWKTENDISLTTLEVPECNSARPPIRGFGDGCDALSTDAPSTDPEVLPTSLIFKLIHHVWNIPPGKHSLASLSFTKYIHAYLVNKTCQITSKEAWTKYLGLLQDSLWPGGEWESGDTDKVTWLNASAEVKNDAMRRAQRCLERELPDALQYLMTDQTYKQGITQLLESLQNPNINRQFICRLLDLVIQSVFPDLDQVAERNHVLLSTHNDLPRSNH